jgi:HlyD family secretion protein
MATSKKRRKWLVFTLIGLVLAGLVTLAILKKREVVVTVQTEKVERRNVNEVVPANGKIQPVLQVEISPEVSGEIIDLPVKEGQHVNKGDLLLKIKPDFYQAAVDQAEAGYRAALAGQTTAEAQLRKALADLKRDEELLRHKLVSVSDFDAVKAAYDVAVAQLDSAVHQAESAKANEDSAKESLNKTTIVSPLTGTISKLNSRLGERVLGTIQNVGTDIMTIADLNEMEARVDIGEDDVVLIAPGQKAKLEVDAFKDRKFSGIVTEIANSSNDSGTQAQMAQSSSSSTGQEATKFQVRIRVQEKEAFRPGMSVTAEIETRYRTNVLTVPIACVTSRLPKEKKNDAKPGALDDPPGTNAPAGKTSLLAATATASNTPSASTNAVASDKKSKEAPKQINVVFVLDGDHVKMVPVKIGISDDNYWEITEGLNDGVEVISGSYKAINRELEDGKRIRKGPAAGDQGKEPGKKE